MSKLKRAYQAGVGNIKAKKAYSPFPRTGLVKKYEPFIRNEVRDYCKQYPSVRYEEMLAEAVKIAVKFEPKFDPNLGNDFSTPLRWHLKELHRFAQKEFSSWQIPVSTAERAANDLEAKRNGIGGDDPRQVNFSGGGNGARLTLDLQSITGPLIDVTASYSLEHRHRVVVGTQLRNSDWDYANGVMDRATPDVKVVLEGRKPSPITSAYIAALLAHSEQRQRETDQEAENQRNGDWAPVFLTPNQLRLDVGFYVGRQPPKLDPDYQPIASLNETVTNDDGDLVGNLGDTIADTAPAEAADDRAEELRDAAETERLQAIVDAERPHLSPKETIVLNEWMLGSLTIGEVADKVGMTPGGASKMAARLEKRLRTKK